MDPVDQISKSNYATFANNPIFYSDPTGFKEYKSMGDFKEETGNDKLGEGDWLTSDREDLTVKWESANIYNLQNLKPYEYTQIEQRADFYKWFQGYSDKLGFETKWAGAAYDIAFAIDMGDFWFGPFSSEIDNFNDDGNELILLDVLPKLKSLINGPVLKGRDALFWDAKTLKEEQLLVQTLYNQISSSSLSFLKFSATFLSWGAGNGYFPPNSDLNNPQDRWGYGMKGMRYTDSSDKLYKSIKAGKSYLDGTKATNLLYLKQFKKIKFD